MNSIFIGLVIASGIIMLSAYAVSSIGDISSASTDSNQIDIKKMSENLDAKIDDDKIHVKNNGKHDLHIAMFRFYDSDGDETHRRITYDSRDKMFGLDVSIAEHTSLDDSDFNVKSHTTKTYDLSDLDLPSVEGLSGEIITNHGRAFPIEFIETSQTDSVVDDGSETNNDSTATGSAVLDGMSVKLSIDTTTNEGRVFFGNDVTGQQTALRPYVGIPGDTAWVGLVKDSDVSTEMTIPRFNSAFSYSSGSLTETPIVKPNILGYSAFVHERFFNYKYEWRNGTWGYAGVTSDDGIRISSSNDDYLFNTNQMRGVDSVITGTLDGAIPGDHSGSKLIIFQGRSVDLTDSSEIMRRNCDRYNTFTNIKCTSVVVGDASGYYLHWGFPDYFMGKSDLTLKGTSVEQKPLGWRNSMISVHTKSYEADTDFYVHNGSRLRMDIKLDDEINPRYIENSISVEGTARGDWYHVQKIKIDSSKKHYYNMGLEEIRFYSKNPAVELFRFDTAQFERPYTWPSDTYLYFETRADGDYSVRAVANDPLSDPYLKITGLPANTLYEVSKSEMVAATGITSATGEIFLTTSQLNLGESTSVTGTLTLYPDSITHRGTYGTLMIDILNDQNQLITFGDDLVYVPSAFMILKFPTSVTITNLNLDGIAINYLNRTYSPGDVMYIPAIPSAKKINMTVNGTPVSIDISKMSGSSVTRAIPAKSMTSSDYSISTSAATSSDVSSMVHFIAPRTGQVAISVTGGVSAESEFSINARYVGPMRTFSQCSISGTSDTSYSCRMSTVPIDSNAMMGLDELTKVYRDNLIDSVRDGNIYRLTVYADIFRNGVLNDAPIKIHEVDSRMVRASPSSVVIDVPFAIGHTIHLTYPKDIITSTITTDVDVGDYVEVQVRANLEVKGVPAPVSGASDFHSYAKSTTSFHGGTITVNMN